CITLNWYTKPVGKPRIYERDRVIEDHPCLANGWSVAELDQMQNFLNGQVIILDGFVRLMPARLEHISVEMTVAAAEEQIRRAELHISAGRIPILKDATISELRRRAEQYEIEQYGKPL